MSSLGLRFGYGDESTPPAPPPPPLPPRRPPVVKKKSLNIPLPPRGVPRQRCKPVLYLRLATTTMSCLAELVSSKDPTLRKFVQDNLCAEHISCLAWLVQNVDVLISMLDSSSKVESSFVLELAGFGSDLMDMLQAMIVSGVIGQQYLQGILLNELGMSAKCWPLKITHSSLSLLGRVLVCRLGEEGGKGEDDRLAVNIWKG